MTPSPKVENPAATAGHFAYLLLVLSCLFAGPALLSVTEKFTVRAHETTWFIFHYQTGSAQVVFRERQQNE